MPWSVPVCAAPEQRIERLRCFQAGGAVIPPAENMDLIRGNIDIFVDWCLWRRDNDIALVALDPRMLLFSCTRETSRQRHPGSHRCTHSLCGGLSNVADIFRHAAWWNRVRSWSWSHPFPPVLHLCRPSVTRDPAHPPPSPSPGDAPSTLEPGSATLAQRPA